MNNTTSSQDIHLFQGIDRIYACAALIVISVLSILLHVLFLTAVRRQCGWQVKFAYTLLLLISLVGVNYCVWEIVASFMAMLFLGLDEWKRPYRIVGTLSIVSFFTTTPLHILLALHRLIATAFPTRAKAVMKTPLLKFLLLLVALYTIAFIAMNQSDLMGFVYDPEVLSSILLKLPLKYVLSYMNSVNNYASAAVHLVAYPIVFLILFFRRNLSLHTTRDMRMTMQIFLMVLIELAFLLFWEFGGGLETAVDMTIFEASNIAYFDAVALPYLILNKTIRSEVSRVSRVAPVSHGEVTSKRQQGEEGVFKVRKRSNK